MRVYSLGCEPADDLGKTSTAQERLAMLEALTLEAFSLAGRPLPNYTRDEAPIAVRRLGE